MTTFAGTREGQVYFLRRTSDQAIKIGWSKDPLQRQSEVERRAATDVDLIATFPAQRAVEYALHQRFASERLDGEWFASHDRLEEAVELVRLFWDSHDCRR